MVARATPRAAPAFTEEGRAATRTLLTMTVATGAMVSLIDLAVGSIPLVAVPALALLVGLVCLRFVGWTAALTRATGWAGTAVWLVIVPTAGGEAVLVPLAMAAICATVAIGPARVLSWVARDVAGRDVDRVAEERANGPPAAGWIEDLPTQR